MTPKAPDNDISPNPADASGQSAAPAQDEQSTLEPQQPAPSAVGIALGQARRAKSMSLSQAAVRLRIKSSFLKALEEGDAAALPGHVYALGFVRSYAEYLGLDPAQIVQDYKQEAADLDHETELSFPVATTPRSTTGIPLMVVLGALSLAGLAGWVATQSNTIRVAQSIPTPPGISTAELTIIAGSDPGTAPPDRANQHIATALLDIARPKSPTAQTPPAPQLTRRQILPTANVGGPIPWPAYVLPLDVVAALKQQSAGAQTPPPTPRRRPVEDIAAAVQENTPTVKTGPGFITTFEQPQTPARGATPNDDMPAGAPQATSTREIPAIPAEVDTSGQGRAYGQANRDARIIIAAEADIWIQIRDRDQNDLFTRLLRAGDSYRVPNRPDLLLFTGNAGGLRLTVDGKPIAPLGLDGAVRRDVALNADSLLSTTIQ